MHFSGEGRNVLSQSRTRSRATKEPCLKCYSQSRFSFLLDMAPWGQGQKPQGPLPGDGSLPHFSSYTSTGSSPQWRTIPITSFLHPLSLPFLVTDWCPPQVPPESTLWQGTATPSLLNWFPPCPYLDQAYAGDFHHWPSLSFPLPTEEVQPVGGPSLSNRY